MIRFRHPIACAFLVLQTTGWISGASAAGCQRADASLAGHYYMGGVMEVGSELQLKATGEFEYMLAYGALDEYATGCWSREGQTVTLVVSKFEANAEDPMKFERLDLEITSGGKLVRRFDGSHSGTYSR
ncbi:hypothetical protein IYW40_14425 [Methylocystis sp. H4A]|uniref:hypothetical protein n=1 Tax=Methylocystis sp. H4A TaxID=2785788 RepID=UPI0018C2B0DE|nr:hypothetical protein [Methylocystis sp. H4A]MBG0802662.1 hypothetical protein [Methylocystis sp. H4A]